MRFWRKTQSPVNAFIPSIIAVFEKGNKDEIRSILWQPLDHPVNYLPITFELLLRLKPPEESRDRLSVYKIHSNKRHSLVIFNIPWADGKAPFSPIIVDNATGKVVGIMLPFNELYELLSKQAYKSVCDLGIVWTMFIADRKKIVV